MIETICRVEEEIKSLAELGKLRWLQDDEQENYLFDDPLLFEILNHHNNHSQLFSFLLNSRAFHFLIHYDHFNPQIQNFLQFFWNTELPLLQLVADNIRER